MKYNVVLIPKSDKVNRNLITLAREISVGNGLEPDYLLKDTDQFSIPHVSVFQFESDNQILLEPIWKNVINTWNEVLATNGNREVLICTLPQAINYRPNTTGTFAGITWAEITINKVANPLLQQFHDKLSKELTSIGISCLNAAGVLYRPHFTLFNVLTSSLEKKQLIKYIPARYTSTLNSFSVRPAFGLGNDNWELTRKLFDAP